jgi:glycosyltransferase involved in cell wall biosynthesis
MCVNVIIPVRNGARYIGDAVSSALWQASVERVFVVDDQSVDETADIAASFCDERITLIRGGGRGVSAARNLGFAEANRAIPEQEGDRNWVMFLDADDRLVPGAVRKLLEAAHPDSAAVYGNYQRIDADGNRIGRRGILLGRHKPSGDILPELLTGNFIVNGGVMLMRHSAFRRTAGFDETLRYCEDWHLFCRLAALGPIVYCPRTTVLEYRVHGDSAMMSGRLDFDDYREAFERIFTDPQIVGKVDRADLAEVGKCAEAHLKTYLACQAIRGGAYGRAVMGAAGVMVALPLRIPKTLAHTLGALAGL